MNNLPPGPWAYDSDANCVRSAIGVAFCMANKALADLLIRAEREADETPLTIEDVERMLGRKRANDMQIFDVSAEWRFEDTGRGWDAWDWYGDPCNVATLKTHGEFRTFCRLFGIEVKE